MLGLASIFSDEDVAAALARSADQEQDEFNPADVPASAPLDEAAQRDAEPLLGGYRVIDDLGVEGLA